MNNGLHQDHYKWGWDGSWYNLPASDSSQFSVCFTSAGTSGSFHDETIRAATLMANAYSKPFMVGLSAGLDSQIICLALKEIKVPFVAATMRWLDNYGHTINVDDTNYAMDFCKLHGIQHIIIDYPIEQFLIEAGSDVARKYNITRYRHLAQVHLVELYKDSHTILIGDGNPTFDMVDGELKIEISSTCLQRYYINEGVEGTSLFFKYTPELYLSQMDNVFCDAFLGGAYKSMFDAFTQDSKTPWLTWRLFTSYFKPLICQANWDGLLHRSKQHGFETYADDETWKKKIEGMGSAQNLLYANAFEFTAFMKESKGTTRIWTS